MRRLWVQNTANASSFYADYHRGNKSSDCFRAVLLRWHNRSHHSGYVLLALIITAEINKNRHSLFRKCSPCGWVSTWKKTVANDGTGIKHLTLKFRGPMGLGGMNKWKNELLKEHWPKSWMCSSHVMMVCYCNCSQSRRVWRRESVCPARKRMCARFHRLLCCPGKSPGQNRISHSHWVKIWDETTTVKSINAPNQNSKFFLLHCQYFQLMDSFSGIIGQHDILIDSMLLLRE